MAFHPIPALAAAASAAMALWQWRKWSLGVASRAWPRVQGTIVDIRFGESTIRVPDGDEIHRVSAQMTYEYMVGARRYRSQHFTYRPTRGLGQQEAYGMLRGLCRGQPVEVYHDPDDPERAVVLPGVDGGNIMRICGWCIALCMSLWWLFAG
jgi:Protein of unknown function (DUF3592)